MTLAVTTAPRRRRPLSSLFDDVFEDFFASTRGGAGHSSGGLPAMNVSETREAYRLAFELPGVPQENVQVQLDGDQLTVSAERRFESEKSEGEDYHRVEHRYGSFARSIVLPKDVSTEGIDASFRNGVLTVSVPKVEPSQARRIEVRGDNS